MAPGGFCRLHTTVAQGSSPREPQLHRSLQPKPSIIIPSGLPLSVAVSSSLSPAPVSTITQSFTPVHSSQPAAAWTCTIGPALKLPQPAYGMVHVVKGSQFYLHTLCSSATLPFSSQPKLVLIYRPRKDGRLSWPGWLVTYWNKCLAPGTEPGHGYPSKY